MDIYNELDPRRDHEGSDEVKLSLWIFPIVIKLVARYVRHLLCNQTYGTSGLMTRFSRSSPVVVTGELGLPRSILSIFRRMKVNRRGFASIPSFNCENLITYDQSLILRVIGSLSTSAMHRIDACLKAVLGIP